MGQNNIERYGSIFVLTVTKKYSIASFYFSNRPLQFSLLLTPQCFHSKARGWRSRKRTECKKPSAYLLILLSVNFWPSL